MKVTTIRMADDEYEQMERRCATADVSVSDYIRGLIATENHNFLVDEAAYLAARADHTGFSTEWHRDCDALEAAPHDD